VGADVFLQNDEVAVQPIQPGDSFVVQFSAAEMEQVELLIGDTGSAFVDLELEVFSPTGQRIFSDIFLNPLVPSTFFTEESGVYTAIFRRNASAFSSVLVPFQVSVTDPNAPLEINFLRDGEPATNPELLVRPDEVTSLAFEFSRDVFVDPFDFVVRRVGEPPFPDLVFIRLKSPKTRSLSVGRR